MPDSNFLSHPIVISTQVKTGVVHFDLTPYNVIVSGDFIASLEWIKDFGKGELAFSAGLGSGFYCREVSQGNWEKFPMAEVGFNFLAEY